MNTRPFPRLRLQRLLHAFVLLALLFSPLQSIAAYAPPPAPPAPAPPSMPEYTGLFRTTVTLRTPADWARLEELGVVVLERTAQGRTADGQENADQGRVQSAVSRESAVLLVDEDQLEALARLRFEPQSTDELGGLVMAHAQAKPWLVAGVRLEAVRTAD